MVVIDNEFVPGRAKATEWYLLRIRELVPSQFILFYFFFHVLYLFLLSLFFVQTCYVFYFIVPASCKLGSFTDYQGHLALMARRGPLSKVKVETSFSSPSVLDGTEGMGEWFLLKLHPVFESENPLSTSHVSRLSLLNLTLFFTVHAAPPCCSSFCKLP